MNVSNISAEEAFNSGSELWIIENDFKNYWWNEVDFRSGFLLSSCLYHHKKPVSSQMSQLLSETEMKSYSFNEDANTLLLGSSQHFLNKWILLWQNSPESVAQKVQQMIPSLKVKNIRVFSQDKSLKQLLETRLTASFDQISYVEDPKIV